MKKNVFLYLVFVCLICLAPSCINSSTSMAFRSITYISTPEIGNDGNVEAAETAGAATVNAEKSTSLDADVPISNNAGKASTGASTAE